MPLLWCFVLLRLRLRSREGPRSGFLLPVDGEDGASHEIFGHRQMTGNIELIV
jgi:hypothetical protein